MSWGMTCAATLMINASIVAMFFHMFGWLEAACVSPDGKILPFADVAKETG